MSGTRKLNRAVTVSDPLPVSDNELLTEMTLLLNRLNDTQDEILIQLRISNRYEAEKFPCELKEDDLL